MSYSFPKTSMLLILAYFINYIQTSSKTNLQLNYSTHNHGNSLLQVNPSIFKNNDLQKLCNFMNMFCHNQNPSFSAKNSDARKEILFKEHDQLKYNPFTAHRKIPLFEVAPAALIRDILMNNQCRLLSTSFAMTSPRLDTFPNRMEWLQLSKFLWKFIKSRKNSPKRVPLLKLQQETSDEGLSHIYRLSKLSTRKVLSFTSDDYYLNDSPSREKHSEAVLLGRVVPHPNLSHQNFINQAAQSLLLDKVYYLKNIYQQAGGSPPTKTSHGPHHQSDDLTRELFSPNVPFFEEPLNRDIFTGNYSNCTNCTEDLPHAPTFQRSTLVKGVILSIIAFLSFVGNMATLCSILKTHRQGTSTVYMLLLQLALADLLVTMFCILAEGVWTLTVDWRGGNVLCKVVKFMQMFSLYLSTFVLVLIGFDRLCAVRFPMHRAHAKHHVRRGIATIWILSGVFSAPQVAIFRVLKGPFVEEFYQCVTYGFYSALWQEQLYTTITLVLMFLLPLLILVATYVTTFVTITSRQNMFSERMSRSPFDDARHNILHKAKVKSLMITVVIVLTFVVCWTPYYAMMVIFMFLEPDEQLGQDLQSAIFFFGSSTALLNPLIYGAFHLRPRARKPRSKSTSFYFSSSSKVDNSTYRKSHCRRSHGEIVNMQVNGRHHSLVASYRNGMQNGMQISSF